MKIIEALKTIKANKKKVEDLIVKITENSAFLSNQTSPYGNQVETTRQVDGWIDSVRQILRDNEILTHRIHKTNNSTLVSIDVGKYSVEKTIDEWLSRRESGVELHLRAYKALTDRRLREEFIVQPDGTRVPITIVRNYNAAARDDAISLLDIEKSLIDSRLEIVNATVDLLE